MLLTQSHNFVKVLTAGGTKFGYFLVDCLGEEAFVSPYDVICLEDAFSAFDGSVATGVGGNRASCCVSFVFVVTWLQHC